MLSKRINIKGIVINDEEMKISQCEDDTLQLLDGTGHSQILSKFYNFSGLKINEKRLERCG